MPKDKLRNLVYTSDVVTLLEDGLLKVVEGYTTFEEILKIIELDDVTEGHRNNNSTYDLKEALNYTSISHNPEEKDKNKKKKDKVKDKEKELDDFLQKESSTNTSFLNNNEVSSSDDDLTRMEF